MRKELTDRLFLDDHLGCFGEFNREDPVCKKLCALKLRCAVEYEKFSRLELLEDLAVSDSMFTIIQ